MGVSCIFWLVAELTVGDGDISVQSSFGGVRLDFAAEIQGLFSSLVGTSTVWRGELGLVPLDSIFVIVEVSLIMSVGSVAGSSCVA